MNLINHVFNESENAISTTIPYNLKKILIMNGYDEKKLLVVLMISHWTPLKSFQNKLYPT